MRRLFRSRPISRWSRRRLIWRASPNCRRHRAEKTIGDPRRKSLSNGSSCAIPSRREFQPLCGLHRRQPGLAEHAPDAPAGRSTAVAGAQRRRDRSRFVAISRSAPRAASRWRGCCSPRATVTARRAWSQCLAVGGIDGALESRGVRNIPRLAQPRRPSGAHGQAHRRQGFFRRKRAAHRLGSDEISS